VNIKYIRNSLNLYYRYQFNVIMNTQDQDVEVYLGSVKQLTIDGITISVYEGTLIMLYLTSLAN